jgi:hypothetical protein
LPGRGRDLEFLRISCRPPRPIWRKVAYAHHEVQVRGYVGEVVIGVGTEVVARHRRSYEKADMIFDPLHFLPLLERKIGALA